MGNIADEFYDEYYATTCPECRENAVDQYEEKAEQDEEIQYEDEDTDDAE